MIKALTPYYPLLCVMVPCTVWIICNAKGLAGKTNRLRHLVWAYVFILYIYAAVFDAADIGTIWDVLENGGLTPNINLTPFGGSTKLFNYLNVLMFMPLGFLLPLIWKNFRNLFKVSLTGFCMSLTIEIFQFFNHRVSDVDDLIMNTIGALVGFVIWWLFKCVFKNAGEKAIAITESEPLAYIAWGTLGIVFLYNYRWV